MFVVLAVRVDSLPLLVTLCWLAALAVVLAVVDAGVHRLPNALTVPAGAGLLAGLALTATVEDQPASLVRALVAGPALFAAYVTVATLSPAAMGLGDCKLAAVLGGALGWFGWTAVFTATVVAHVLAAAYALGRLALHCSASRDPVAFGPFMVLGAFAAIVLEA